MTTMIDEEQKDLETTETEDSPDVETAVEPEIEPEIEDVQTAGSEAEKISEELEQTKDRLLRTMAEYDNFRKRSAREKDALRADIIANVTSKFLPVMDNLERALNADCSDENYKNGVKMICDSFMETLTGLGVEEIESEGKQFDPSCHQAVQRVSEGDAESGTVVQTFAKGYKIGDKVIRFAVVAVKE